MRRTCLRANHAARVHIPTPATTAGLCLLAENKQSRSRSSHGCKLCDVKTGLRLQPYSTSICLHGGGPPNDFRLPGTIARISSKLLATAHDNNLIDPSSRILSTMTIGARSNARDAAVWLVAARMQHGCPPTINVEWVYGTLSPNTSCNMYATSSACACTTVAEAGSSFGMHSAICGARARVQMCAHRHEYVMYVKIKYLESCAACIATKKLHVCGLHRDAD